KSDSRRRHHPSFPTRRSSDLFPIRPVAWLMRFFIQPISSSRRGPSDRVTELCAGIITNPCPARERLTVDLFKPTKTEGENADGVDRKSTRLNSSHLVISYAVF